MRNDSRYVCENDFGDLEEEEGIRLKLIRPSLTK